MLHLDFRSVVEALIAMLALPFAVDGGVWFMWLLGYDTSVPVRVGAIAPACGRSCGAAGRART